MGKKYVKVTPEVQSLIDKALTTIDNAKKRIQDASDSGTPVQTKHWLDLDRMERDIKAYRSRSKISVSNLGFLREAAHPTYYDKWISYQLKFSEESTKYSKRTGKPVTSYNSKYKWVTQAEINSIKRKELKGTATAEEIQLLSHWQDSTMKANQAINETSLPTVDRSVPATDEDKIRAIRARRASRKLDVSIGGQSDLINDLSYFLGSKLIASDGKYNLSYVPDFIQWYRDEASKNKVFFGEVEQLYRRNTEIRKQLQDAKGANLYVQVRKIAQALVELITKIKESYKKYSADTTLDDIHKNVEAASMTDID